MEFHLKLAQTSANLEAIRESLLAMDPAALADTDALGERLRVATQLNAEDVAWALRRAGVAVGKQDLISIPSVCCGGCSG